MPVDNPKTHELIAAVQGRSLPNKLLVVVPPDQTLPEGHPCTRQDDVERQPHRLYLPARQISAPITNPVALSQMLQLPQQRPPPGTRPQ